MPAHESSITMDTKVIYNKGGKKNGYLPDTFDRPPDWGTNEYSDEDEVFVESPNMDISSATKPLMYPRTRTKFKGRATRMRCRPIVHAVVCFLFLVLSLGSLMGLVVYFVNKHNGHRKHSPGTETISSQTNYRFVKEKSEKDFSHFLGCDHVSVEDVWVVGFPKLLTESAFRLVDVNSDGTFDVILGFATGADGYSIPSIVCDIYFGGAYPCFGGVLALDGATGRELWRHYADHEIYSLNCGADLNKDGVLDCLAGGRAGAFQAVSGKDGSLIWNFGKQEAKNDIMNVYTAQLLPDLDSDDVEDILAIHGGDPLQEPGSAHRLSGRILIMSGKTGRVLNWMGVPDHKESYYSPQTYTLPDGTVVVLFGTGGETHGGSLWKIRLDDLLNGDISQAIAIYTDKFKGIMTPPVLADVTNDGIVDIIIPAFNSSVLAFDGLTSRLIWNHTFPGSESYNTPSPGYYNNDDDPDFLVKSAYGPGFPVYYHSETTVLDGRTGKSLIDPPIRDTVGAQASGLTVSMEGRGNDLFLYWAADCKEHTGEGGEFKFVEGTNVHEQSRSDFCRLRFKTKGYSKIYAINAQIPSPGTTIYYSENRTEMEHSKWVNTTKEGLEFVMSHPEYLEEYRNFLDTELGQTEPSQFENIPMYPKEGSESLFETPLLDTAQRTSYKKGPITGSQYRPSYLKGIGRQRDPTGYDYSDPYYTDPYSTPSRSALGRNRQPGKLFGYSRGKIADTPLYPTTPGYKYSRSRFRTRNRYPSNIRNDRIRERNIQKPLVDKRTNDGGVTTSVKPIAMKERKKRSSSKHWINQSKKSSTERKLNENASPTNRKSTNSRLRRHVGPHDEDGLQRLLSTGTLAPSSLPKTHANYNHSIDFLFATYWFFPAKTRAILPEDKKCIETKMAAEEIRFDQTSVYYGMDHDAYEHAITDECLTQNKHDLPHTGTYESQTQYNPFNIHMGQMTVYRVRLTCTCSNTTSRVTDPNTCAKVLPFDEQQWFGYMGNKADSHWWPRQI